MFRLCRYIFTRSNLSDCREMPRQKYTRDLFEGRTPAKIHSEISLPFSEFYKGSKSAKYGFQHQSLLTDCGFKIEEEEE